MDHKSQKIYIIFGLLLVLLTAVYMFSAKPWQRGGGEEVVDEGTPALYSFEVAKPYLLVRGEALERVEVWVIPTGTEITEDQYFMLGTANKSSKNEWTFRIPDEPVLATEIFAKAYDRSEKLVGKKSLPFRGASELNNALWADIAGHLTDERILRVGQESTFEGLRIKILRIVEDSRCPVTVTCIWAGRVQVEASFEAAPAQTTALLSSDGDDYHFGAYSIRIIDVEPAKTEGMLDEGDYRIKVQISR